MMISDTPIEGLKLVDRGVFTDERGSFERLFDLEELMADFGHKVAQVNRARTKGLGTVRGLHAQQSPNSECKLVSCIRGSVFDVAVDLRAESAFFGQWFGVELSELNHRALLIPAGFAHGMQALEMDCELLYVHSAQYAPTSEVGLNPLSAEINIDWPLSALNLSDRDANESRDLQSFRKVKW